jgi:hypothetical protein
MAAPFLDFDLKRELEQLYSEPEWDTGQNARTLVKYDDFRVVLTALKARARLAGHQTEGRILALERDGIAVDRLLDNIIKVVGLNHDHVHALVAEDRRRFEDEWTSCTMRAFSAIRGRAET